MVLPDGYPISHFIVGVVTIAVYIIELLLYEKIVNPSEKHERKVRRAVEMGHVVTATLLSCSERLTEIGNGKYIWEYYPKYNYSVGGITYRYKVGRYTHRPPEEITLYYLQNPKKTFTKQPPADLMVLPLIAVAVMAGIAVKILISV